MRIFIVLMLLMGNCFAAGNDLIVNQRNAANTATETKLVARPVGNADGMFGFNGATQLPVFYTFGSGLSLASGVLSTSAASWAAITDKPTFAPVATSGAYSDLTGLPTTTPWQSIQGAPTTLAGYGITDAVSASALASKFNTPTGTTSQYVRGDGSVADFPTRSFTNPTRSLNTPYQISTTRDAAVTYTVDISVTAVLVTGSSGRVYLDYADNAAMTANLVTVSSSPNATSGLLNLTNVGSGNVTGWIPAGKWVRIRTVNVSSTPTYTFQMSQEVLH